MSQQSPPQPPSPGQSYGQGLQTFLRFLPQMLQSEYGARQQYDPAYVQQQQDLQQQFGPTQYSQQLAALQQLDPYGTAIRNQLGQNVQSQLAQGTNLDPAFQQQLTSEIRGAEAARGGATPGGGNVMGGAPVSAEALYMGRAGQQLYQQRQANAASFLGLRGPEWNIQAVQPVSASDAFRIVNPNAGYLGQQIGQQNYVNQLGAWQLANQGGGSGAGWGSLAGGILGGVAGSYLGGPAGGQLGGSLGSTGGGLIGGYFSDRRLKENIVYTGDTTKDGIPYATFNYKGHEERLKGVVAQDVLKVRPDAVFCLGNMLGVNYDAIGATLSPE